MWRESASVDSVPGVTGSPRDTLPMRSISLIRARGAPMRDGHDQPFRSVVVMNFVSKTVSAGFLQYLLENALAESFFGLKIAQPSSCSRQSMPGCRIFGAAIGEFDYRHDSDRQQRAF